MLVKSKFIILASVIFLFFTSSLFAEEEEIYLKAISDQIQVITKDLKTLEKGLRKIDVISSKSIKSIKSDGLSRYND